MGYPVHNPTVTDVSMATTELVLGILREFPHVQIKPHPPYDDEDICLDVHLLGTPDELAAARQRVVELEIEIQDKYRVYTVVMVLPQ
jgi:hypothetical protein